MNDILVVEDDMDLCTLLKIHLVKNNYVPSFCRSGKEIKNIGFVKKYDLILLDLFLPDESGIALCKKIRDISYTPIIFMSCMSDSNYKIQALSAGGDDYLVKPLDYRELLTRIAVHIRRATLYSQDALKTERKILINDLQLDCDLNQVTRDGMVLNLTQLEFKILSYLVRNKNTLVDYFSLYKNIWNCDSCGDIRTVMVHVSNLRKKLETPTVNYIKTVRNKGYIFCDE